MSAVLTFIYFCHLVLISHSSRVLPTVLLLKCPKCQQNEVLHTLYMILGS
jgi:hypothetical protein